MKIVVADTGVLISLGLIGKVELIEKVFDELYIAEAVWNELHTMRHKRDSFPNS